MDEFTSGTHREGRAYRYPMLRYALAPRWWVTHLIVLALFLGCVRLGMWQWTVAHTPGPGGDGGVNVRNAVYAVQWWFFACVGVWFWTRFLRDQRVADDEWTAAYWAEQEALAREAQEQGEPESPDSLTR